MNAPWEWCYPVRCTSASMSCSIRGSIPSLVSAYLLQNFKTVMRTSLLRAITARPWFLVDKPCQLINSYEFYYWLFIFLYSNILLLHLAECYKTFSIGSTVIWTIYYFSYFRMLGHAKISKRASWKVLA